MVEVYLQLWDSKPPPQPGHRLHPPPCFFTIMLGTCALATCGESFEARPRLLSDTRSSTKWSFCQNFSRFSWFYKKRWTCFFKLAKFYLFNFQKDIVMGLFPLLRWGLTIPKSAWTGVELVPRPWWSRVCSWWCRWPKVCSCAQQCCPGEGKLPLMDYTGRLRPKGVLFQAGHRAGGI